MSKLRFGGGMLAVCAALFGVGCGHTRAHAVAFDAPPGGKDVVVLASAAPPRVGRLLGEVSASGEGGDARELYADLVRQTRALGGNALVLESMGARLGAREEIYSALGSAHGCGASCSDGASSVATDETMAVELRGKALLLSPDEKEALRRLPPAPRPRPPEVAPPPPAPQASNNMERTP
jgi:hypothetical protein